MDSRDSHNVNKQHDCIIIGGGPAGATCGAILAEYGHDVLMLEKDTFPRHHIGESLMPQTYWTFKRLGLLEKMKASAYPCKESVQFVSASGKESQPFYFTDRDPAEWSRTWQVHRETFDPMMLDNAREKGVTVRQGVAVKNVLFEGDRAVGVVMIEDGESVELRATVVIDASGSSAILSRQLDLYAPDPRLKNASIYAYYKNAERDMGRNAGATIIIHTENKTGWFWFIPLPDNVASIGVVAPPSHLFTGRGDAPQAILDEEIQNCRGIRRRLEQAERISDARVTRDFSYSASRTSGDGWLLIGDAFGFLDPVYSSGLMLALKSGELAADTVHGALVAGDVSVARLQSFAPPIDAAIGTIRKLVYTFYDRQFSFARFLKQHPQYHDHIVRILIGDVFNDDVAEVFTELGKWVDLGDEQATEENTDSEQYTATERNGTNP